MHIMYVKGTGHGGAFSLFPVHVDVEGMRAGQEDGVKIGGCLLFRVCPCWLIFS